jgi:organic radical activating enzyme
MSRLIDEGRIFLQPLDEQDPQANSANIKRCAELCLLHGFRLCIQIQKIASLP